MNTLIYARLTIEKLDAPIPPLFTSHRTANPHMRTVHDFHQINPLYFPGAVPDTFLRMEVCFLPLPVTVSKRLLTAIRERLMR